MTWDENNEKITMQRVESLQYRGLRILQTPGRTRFGMDAVLLAHFTTVEPGEQGLDLGTGTGVIPLLLAGREPNCRMDALEIMGPMAQLAARSVTMNGLEGRIRVLRGDLRQEPGRTLAGGYDFIVCNPPYFPLGCGSQSPDPLVAAARHEVCCTLTDVVMAADRLALPAGRLSVIIPEQRMGELTNLLTAAGWDINRSCAVCHCAGGPPLRRLCEAVRGHGRRETLPPLIAYEDGQFTPRMRAIYHMEEEPDG